MIFSMLSRSVRIVFPATLISVLSLSAHAENISLLPPPTSPEFCVAVQHILANTQVKPTNTVFDNMDEYRASKPSPDPLMIYQIVTYDGTMPIAVSCKVKTADHLRATYGESAAGEQLYCPTITEMIKAQAIAELEEEGATDAAAKVRTMVIDQNEPYVTGSAYLSTFELSYVGADGKIHINTPALQTNWEDWMFWIMPNRVRGQTYCHLATVPYIKDLGKGAIEPGTLIVTTDDAKTKPSS
jgi:hypothetical protein